MTFEHHYYAADLICVCFRTAAVWLIRTGATISNAAIGVIVGFLALGIVVLNPELRKYLP